MMLKCQEKTLAVVYHSHSDTIYFCFSSGINVHTMYKSRLLKIQLAVFQMSADKHWCMYRKEEIPSISRWINL